MNSDNKITQLWNAILTDARFQKSVGDYGMSEFFSRISLIQDTETHLVLQHPSDFPIAWIEVNYLDSIKEAAARLLCASREISFVAAAADEAVLEDEEVSLASTATLQAPTTTDELPLFSLSALDESPSSSPSNANKSIAETPKKSRKKETNNLNPNFTFENFVVGSNSEYAYTAATAVAEADEMLYNPLFIYGASGLGKTHLLHAIGNAIYAKNPSKRVLYITSEDFTNAYVDAMYKKGDALSTFRRKYRQADVLLIDDIQFLADKVKTQEEFFHTFNALFTSGKHIILSADCPSSEITALNSRLTSRFEQGMTVGVTLPPLETRMAILRYKRKMLKHNMVSDEVLNFLAKNITRSVRHLEGALTRVAVHASFTQTTPTVDDVRIQLKDLLQAEESQVITIKDIKVRVAEAFDVRVMDLDSRSRLAAIAHPRQIAMYLSRKHTEETLQEIGEAFGGRDHGTVIHATRPVEKKLRLDPSLRELVMRVSTSFA